VSRGDPGGVGTNDGAVVGTDSWKFVGIHDARLVIRSVTEHLGE
jgi:hypothetical protein